MASNSRACLGVVVVLVFMLVSKVFIWEADAAGERGRTPIRSAAASLSPCLGAAGNARLKVPPACCTKIGALIKSEPKCLCAVLLSPLAKQAGIKPAIAITVPKRCNIKNRPAGKKCGRTTCKVWFLTMLLNGDVKTGLHEQITFKSFPPITMLLNGDGKSYAASSFSIQQAAFPLQSYIPPSHLPWFGDDGFTGSRVVLGSGICNYPLSPLRGFALS